MNINWILSSLLLFVLANLITGQFPMVCYKNITEQYGECCPIPNGYITQCGWPERGACEQIPEVRVKYWPDLPVGPQAGQGEAWEELDERLNWPHRYVSRGCRCRGNYHGPDCSRCLTGYTGASCDKKESPRVRRNVMTYTADEKRVFVDTLLLAKNVTSQLGAVIPVRDENSNRTNVHMVALSIWDMFQFLHYRTSHRTICSREDLNLNFAHRGPNFPVWHRKYLLWVEEELRTVSDDPEFTLPYWDWIDAANCTVCTNDLVGKVNMSDFRLEDASPFSAWRTPCSPFGGDRCALCDPSIPFGPIIRNGNTDYPTNNAIDRMLETRVYDTPGNGQPGFRFLLEDVHNKVHRAIGGLMSSLLTAANDPIFLLHHTFVDKLAEVWIQKERANLIQYPHSQRGPGHLAEEPMVPWFPQENNINYYKLAGELGYRYDTLCLSYQDPITCEAISGPKSDEPPSTEPGTTADSRQTTPYTTQNTVSDSTGTGNVSSDGTTGSIGTRVVGISTSEPTTEFYTTNTNTVPITSAPDVTSGFPDTTSPPADTVNVWKIICIILIILFILLIFSLAIWFIFCSKKKNQQGRDRHEDREALLPPGGSNQDYRTTGYVPFEGHPAESRS